jgi:serine protease inhibitor
MVKLAQTPNISWLVDLEADGDDGRPYLIAEALQQTRLRMNEFGVRAESAVALAVAAGSFRSAPRYVLDRPFLIWIERTGLSIPLFVGHIGTDDWDNPGSITA